MFLEGYALQDNPFSLPTERPLVESVSGREVAAKLKKAATGRLQCLAISGPAGAGKSLAVQRGLYYFEGWFRSWVDCPIPGSQAFLGRLLTDLGLGDVEGGIQELRNILEVYLRHQAARRRPGLLVVDNLDSASPEVVELLSWLAGLRLRGRPILCLVLISRSDELVARLLPAATKQVGELHQHQKFRGFTPEETRDYIHACLTQAGCSDPMELIGDAACKEIQGFSGGIPRRIDALCAAALNTLATNIASVGRRPRVGTMAVRNVAAMLGLEFDEGALATREEPLSREHIHEHNQEQLRIEAARLLVASGGQLVAEVSLNRPRVVLGRDANCDISLDSRFVSRYQSLFLQTDAGWLMIDLNSTNGSFVNGQRIREHVLEDGDVIAVGTHQLRFFSTAAPRPKPASGTRAISTGRLPAVQSPEDSGQTANSQR